MFFKWFLFSAFLKWSNVGPKTKNLFNEYFCKKLGTIITNKTPAKAKHSNYTMKPRSMTLSLISSPLYTLNISFHLLFFLFSFLFCFSSLSFFPLPFFLCIGFPRLLILQIIYSKKVWKWNLISWPRHKRKLVWRLLLLVRW